MIMQVTTDEIKLKQAQKAKIRGTYPLIVNMIKRYGDIADRDTVVTSFGEDAIRLAVHENILKQTKIKKRYKDKTRADEIITVVHLPGYNGDRPAWLDE